MKVALFVETNQVAIIEKALDDRIKVTEVTAVFESKDKWARCKFGGEFGSSCEVFRLNTITRGPWGICVEEIKCVIDPFVCLLVFCFPFFLKGIIFRKRCFVCFPLYLELKSRPATIPSVK